MLTALRRSYAPALRTGARAFSGKNGLKVPNLAVAGASGACPKCIQEESGPREPRAGG